MRKTNTITKFHNNAPKRLIRIYKQHNGNCYRVSQLLGVNPNQVWSLLKEGTEPRREDLRHKLFLRHKLTKEELEQRRVIKKQKQKQIELEILQHIKRVMEVYNVEEQTKSKTT